MEARGRGGGAGEVADFAPRYGQFGWIKAWVVPATYHVLEGRDAFLRHFS